MPPKNEPTATPPVEPVAPAAPATPPSSEPVATPPEQKVPEGFELIRTEDKNKLISQRDKANNGNSETETVVNALLQKDAVRDAVASPEFKENYPDVTMQELLDANPTSDEEIEAFAKAKQARYEEVKQTALKNVQRAEAPTLTQADKDTKLTELAQPAKRSRFQDALKLARTQVK